MQTKEKPLLLYGILLVVFAFVIGYLIGHGNGVTEVTVKTVAPQQSAAVTQPTEAEKPAVLQEPTPDAPLNINTASQAELELLPGIGPGLAGRIVTYRQENGLFIAKEQLMDVEGIGDHRYAELEPLITIGGTP